jgi:hypothetical protein
MTAICEAKALGFNTTRECPSAPTYRVVDTTDFRNWLVCARHMAPTVHKVVRETQRAVRVEPYSQEEKR